MKIVVTMADDTPIDVMDILVTYLVTCRPFVLDAAIDYAS